MEKDVFSPPTRPGNEASCSADPRGMALQVSYRYKTQVTEESQRRLEGIKVKRKFPAKIPVSNGLSCSCLYCVVYLCGLVGGGASDKLCHHELNTIDTDVISMVTHTSDSGKHRTTSSHCSSNRSKLNMYTH